MQYCEKCHISVRGNKSVCPLCQGELTGTPETSPGPFPALTRRGMSRFSAIRLITLISALAAVAFLIVFVASGLRYRWVIFTLIGIGVGWIDTIVALTMRTNLLRTIAFQTYFSMAALIVIDVLTGFHAWSLNWVIPCMFAGYVPLIIFVARALGYRLEEYIMYLAIALVLCYLQLIPILLKLTTFFWPAVISMALLTCLGIIALLFRFRDIRAASGKMFSL